MNTTENNHQDLLKITAGIVETARRNVGMTQKELAESLGVIQSTISRIEKGILSPTLFHWMEMCEILKIPQNAISLGHIDNTTVAKITSSTKEGGHNIPKKYRDLRCFKVRLILPLINYARAEMGDAACDNLLKEMGMKPTFFINLDNQVNIAFVHDLIGIIGKNQKINKSIAKNILNYASRPSSHGVLSTLYNNASDQIDLMDRYFKNISKYQRAYNFEIKDIKANQLLFHTSPTELIKPTIHSIGAETENFLWDFYTIYLKRFSLYDYKNKLGQAKEIQVESGQRDKDLGRDVVLTMA